MDIGGISVILILGILNICLIAFQLLSGMRIIRIPNKIHRGTGIILCASATCHAILALLAHS